MPSVAPALASPRTEALPAQRRGAGDVVEVAPADGREGHGWTEAPQAKTVVEAIPRSTTEQRPKPAIFVPARPPDDPGVAQTETDESPTSLERLRAAQIR
jgi:hypothetical protein